MGKLKVRIDKVQCVGNARCHAAAADLFPLDDNGYIAIDGFDVDDVNEVLARRGVKACPERIITIIKED